MKSKVKGLRSKIEKESVEEIGDEFEKDGLRQECGFYAHCIGFNKLVVSKHTMSQSEVASEEVVEVGFGLLTTEEVKKMSVVRIHNPTLMASDTRPMPGGLYDPAMGPLNEASM